MIILTTFFLLVWLAVPYVNARFDVDGHKPNYLQVFIARGMAALVHWCLFVKSPDQWPILFWLVVFQLCSFWLTFEILLNVWRGRALLHYDFVELDSGYIDRFFAKLYRKTKTHAFHWLAKLIALASMVFSIVRIYALR